MVKDTPKTSEDYEKDMEIIDLVIIREDRQVIKVYARVC